MKAVYSNDGFLHFLKTIYTNKLLAIIQHCDDASRRQIWKILRYKEKDTRQTAVSLSIERI